MRFRAVVRYVGYKGWWWHVEDAEGQLVNFIGSPVRDMKAPDGVALRGRALTRRGAQRKAGAALRQAEFFLPPEGGPKPRKWVTELP